MININKYNKVSDYLSDEKITDESIVSQVDNSVVYTGVNVLLKGDQLSEDSVCVVAKDSTTGEPVYIPIETYQAAMLDTRYTVQDFILFGMTNGKKLYMHKNSAESAMWAASNRYHLECDLTANGGFSWAITLNGTATSGTVRWDNGDTLQSVLDQLTPQASAQISFALDDDGKYIKITCNSYSNSTLTLSENTGATLVDLSAYCKIGGVNQAQVHRTWQGQSVAALFPESGFLPANATQYARSGINLSYRCGGNLERFKAYYRTNGSAEYISEDTLSSRMSEAGFAALNGSGNVAAQALYDKYNGSWDAYMEASMIQINDRKRDGVEFRSYDNGGLQNGFLASVMTLDFDMETWIPAYPAAYNASQTSIDGNPGCLMTNHQIGLVMDDQRYQKIRTALSAIGGTPIANNQYYWLVSEYAAGSAWLFNGTSGCVNYYPKYLVTGVRPVHASA